MSVGPNINRT